MRQTYKAAWPVYAGRWHQSVKMNVRDSHPYSYLKEVFTRLPTQPASRIEDPLPRRWNPATASY